MQVSNARVGSAATNSWLNVHVMTLPVDVFTLAAAAAGNTSTNALNRAGDLLMLLQAQVWCEDL